MGVDVEQPLLKEKPPVLVYLNCPGCKNSYLQDPNAKLPYKEMAVLAALTLVNALPISSLYPFLYFMVKDFHIAESDKDIGFYAGYIGSAFMLGRFATSVLWGMAADKYGRVPVMIIGVISVIAFHTMFGVSTTFWMAVFSRLLLGGFNGMLGTVKAYASEICSERHQALSLSIVGTMWGFGLIIGPAMGGYFSQPAIKYPKLFPHDSLFDRFPYLLPSLCVTVIAVPTLFITFTLPETLHKHDAGVIETVEEATHKTLSNPSISSHLSRASSRKYTVCEGDESLALISPKESLHDSTFEDGFQHQGNRRSQECDRFHSQSNSVGNEQSHDDEGINSSYDSNNKDSPGIGSSTEYQVYQVDPQAVEVANKSVANSAKKLVKKPKSLLTSKPLMTSIGVYCIWSLHDMAYTEIFSLWCVSPASNGGLSLDTTDVGQILAISGFTMLLFQLLAFPPLVNFMGAVLVSRMGAGLAALLMVAYPIMTKLHGVTLWVALNCISIIKNSLSVMIFTGSFILVNNSVTQDKRGAANGLSMSLVSLFKAVGPAGVAAYLHGRRAGKVLTFFQVTSLCSSAWGPLHS